MSDFKSWLLIDDDIEDREIFQSAIDIVVPDMFFIAENDPEKALDRLKSNVYLPDIIFLDINMPKMDGFEFITQIKKEGKLKYIPVIFYSTANQKEQIEKAYRLGASGFVTKPSSFKDLCKIIAEYAYNSPIAVH